MVTGVVIPLLLSLRYYRYTTVSSIESSYNTMEKGKCRIINMLIYAAMIVIPVLSFILLSLYVTGSI